MPPNKIQPSTRTHFTFFLHHGNSFNCVMVLVERFLVSFQNILYLVCKGYIIFSSSIFEPKHDFLNARISNLKTHDYNETIFHLSHFPVLYQYKSKVIFHAGKQLLATMCPIFEIDKLDWFGFQRREILFLCICLLTIGFIEHYGFELK